MPSPYDVLGIDPDATDEEIARAYKRRVKDTHPDLGGSAREFRSIVEAYQEITSGEPRNDDTQVPGERRRREDDHGSRVEFIDYDLIADNGWDLDDADLFEKAPIGDHAPSDRGRFLVKPHESLLQAAENRGYTWPYSCRGGACANCAVAVVEGELSMPVNHILPSTMTERGIRLSCVGGPITEEMKVVYNVKHLPDLDELRLPPRQYDRAHSDD